MLGETTKDEFLRQHTEGIPPEFDTDVLPNLTKNQVVFLNETHYEQEGGSVKHTRYQIRFPRDNQGTYCPIPSKNMEPTYVELQSKPTLK